MKWFPCPACNEDASPFGQAEKIREMRRQRLQDANMRAEQEAADKYARSCTKFFKEDVWKVFKSDAWMA